jgi:predicted dinucleotide-binding enzyme
VGGTLGRCWAELGHLVCFGVRDPSDADAKALVSKIKADGRLASVRDAAKDAEVVVLATPSAANAAAIAAAGDLASKILTDVTNPIGPDLAPAVEPAGVIGLGTGSCTAPTIMTRKTRGAVISSST